jgi:FSR family fosmidomycin resistance protein-like MFS transporter
VVSLQFKKTAVEAKMQKNTFRHWHMVSVYSAVHFLVDFACAFLMFRSIAQTPHAYLCVLLYNFCAFAMQMPFGIIADKWNRNYLFAIAGCILAGLAYCLVDIPVAAVVVIGIGNAMFHIGAGIDVLNISEKKLGALGVFVSPGAFGIYFGTMLGRGSDFMAAFIPITLVAAAGLIFVSYKAQRGTYPKNAAFSTAFSVEGVGSLHVITAAICFFIVVCLRSYAGLSWDFPWKGIEHWGTLLICAVVLGKTAGGFIADYFGLFKTVLISLGAAALLFLLPQIPLAGVAAVFLFNMTMPITLWAVAKIFQGAKGFAFGLLTFGLFLGFLPVYLGVSSNEFWLFALIALVSLVLLLAGLRRIKL